MVLLVDDSADDLLLLRRSFEKADAEQAVSTVRSAAEARAYLEGCGEYNDRSRFPLPIVTILDLNMPGEDGFEFLKWLRSHHRLYSIPVVALTGLRQKTDTARAYEAGANSVLVKPQEAECLIEVCRRIAWYWVHISYPPPILQV